ncbi:MAG: helix-turn-helix transcriptional regulator [Spirochaetes bacterium]|nr:helix-turn-helix transcriptional regulator [Spirochaetota bacterium]
MPKTTIHKSIHTLAPDWVFNGGKSFGIVDRENDASLLPWHDHAFMEIYLIYHGRASQKTLRSKEIIKQGDILFFNIDEPHSVIPEKDFSYFVLALTPACIGSITEYISNADFMRQSTIARFLGGKSGGYGKISLPPKTAALAASICRTMHGELTSPSHGGEGIVSLSLYTLFAHIARTLDADGSVKQKPIDERIVRLMEYIQAHPDGDLSAETLSAMTSLNKSYLSRLFTQTTRYTVSEYIAEVRIERACRLLKSTDLPVYRIAERCGYNDLSFFHEKFRAFNGKTPAEYRKKYRST